jgi:surface protein
MASTFSNALRFNQDISSWNVSKVINMRLMFAGAEAFNQNINAWDVSNVTNMEGMFFRAINFNQPIDTWQVNKVTTMRNMFREADHFNQPISNWDVSHVTDMFQMFMNATSFNQDIGNWDVRKVKDMFSMFKSALSFNSDISRWDVSAVINMSNMFENATQFNQDIGKWNVRSVEKMPFILKNATSFDYSLGKWNLSAIKSSTNALESALTNTALSVVKYDSTLIGWSTLTANESRIPTRIKFGANNLHFCEGGAARNVLLAFRWEIVDAGTDCSQTISFPQPDDLIYGDTLVLNALSEVNLPIQYTVTGPAQIRGDTLTTTGVGIVSITAHQNGNLLFQPATPVTIDILIKKATLKATIRDTTKIYGSANPAFTVDYSGFRNNDNENNIPKPVLFTSATEKSEVGTYLIEFIDSGIFSENYDINFQTGTLSIQKALLTISVMDTVKKYGEPNPKFILQFRGFVNNDDENLLSPIMISCAATEQSSPGTYMIEIINNSDSISNNYAVEFFAGVLTILRAKLTINANDTSKTYGEHNPTFTFTSHGLANHESPNILSGIVLATSAQEDSDAGLYPILLSTIPDGILTNYFIDYLQGILTIHKAQASISADFLSQNFDGTPKTPLISTSPSDLLFEITFTGDTTSPTKAGAYPFDVTITENNYTGTLRDTLLINLVLEVSKAGDVKVFPNPVKDRIFIESNHVMQKISIYANNGLLQSQHLADSTTLSLDLAELKPGQYFIEIISSNNRKTFHRLLKL